MCCQNIMYNTLQKNFINHDLQNFKSENSHATGGGGRSMKQFSKIYNILKKLFKF